MFKITPITCNLLKRARPMSSFTQPLSLCPLGEGIFCTVSPFEYHIGHLGSGNVISVPRFYVTDLASIPKCLWGIFPPHWNYVQAAVLHDYLYSHHKLPFKKTNEVFLEAMLVLGVKKWQARLFYYFVKYWKFVYDRGPERYAERIKSVSKNYGKAIEFFSQTP